MVPRRAERVDRDRIVNTDQDILFKYFGVFKETLDIYALLDLPHLNFHCDKAATVSNTIRFMYSFPAAANNHASALCCVTAVGSNFPSHYRHGPSAGRNIHHNGQVIAAVFVGF